MLKQKGLRNTLKPMAAVQGFEPWMLESEAKVLPLHYTAIFIFYLKRSLANVSHLFAVNQPFSLFKITRILGL